MQQQRIPLVLALLSVVPACDRTTAPEPVSPPPIADVEPPAEPVEEPPPPLLDLSAQVHFPFASEEPSAESEQTLQVVLDYLEARRDATLLRIEAHTDAIGSHAANQELSEQRALAVARWLVRHGVDCKRLLPIGFGESEPVADNTTHDGRAQNRRTAFVTAALAGQAVRHEWGGHVAGDPCQGVPEVPEGPDVPDAPPADGTAIDWDHTLFAVIQGSTPDDTTMTFTCPAADEPAKAVYGGADGEYSKSSHTCAAAVHAGAITTDGGTFTIVVRPTLDQYTGSTQHGVTSESSGKFGSKGYRFQ